MEPGEIMPNSMPEAPRAAGRSLSRSARSMADTVEMSAVEFKVSSSTVVSTSIATANNRRPPEVPILLAYMGPMSVRDAADRRC
eukprot:1211807-Rhodomonas_salina.1